jgi:hypothetical protein
MRLSTKNWRSAIQVPAARTRRYMRPSAGTAPVICTGVSFMRASNNAWRSRFSPARFACQLPSHKVSAMNPAAATVGTRRGSKEKLPMRIVILVLLVAVVASLFSGLYFVYKDKGGSNRAVIALTIRIALSIVVFAILMGSYYFGLIPGRGL